MSDNFNITNISQLKQIINFLIAKKVEGVLYLMGDLGTGKTTFTQYFLEALGFSGVVSSPTYAIMNEYEIGKKTIIHADLYRLSEPEELLYLDVREWSERAEFIFIEWPEKGKGFLPSADFICQFSLQKTSRFLSVRENIH